MIKALKLGGFQLLKWKSNHKELNDVTNDPSPPLRLKQSNPMVLPMERSTKRKEGRQTKWTRLRRRKPTKTSAPVQHWRVSRPRRKRRKRRKKEEKEEEEERDDATFPDEDDATFPDAQSPNQLNFAINQDEEVGKILDVMLNVVNDEILGVGYDFKRDMMFLKVGKKLNREVRTKRELLSWISAMYDPLSIIAPYILKSTLYLKGTIILPASK